MSFCTVVNCMDGRIQVPVIEYMQGRFGVDYVDSITEPGPNLILAKQTNINIVESIFHRLKISIERHASVGIAVAGHYDCAGNPSTREEQTGHTIEAIRCIKSRYSELEVIGLWIDENWEVSELSY
jgi:hypothetical protein